MKSIGSRLKQRVSARMRNLEISDADSRSPKSPIDAATPSDPDLNLYDKHEQKRQRYANPIRKLFDELKESANPYLSYELHVNWDGSDIQAAIEFDSPMRRWYEIHLTEEIAAVDENGDEVSQARAFHRSNYANDASDETRPHWEACIEYLKSDFLDLISEPIAQAEFIGGKLRAERTHKAGYDFGLRWAFKATHWQLIRLRDFVKDCGESAASAFYFHESVVSCPEFADCDDPNFLEYIEGLEYLDTDLTDTTEAHRFWQLESSWELKHLPTDYIRGFLEGATKAVRIDYGEEFLDAEDW